MPPQKEEEIMSIRWTQLLRWISGRGQSFAASGPLVQDLGCDASGFVGGKSSQPVWLTPAYLRQRRSGDRVCH